MRSLPIRLRLTLAFAVAMALVLAAMGAFVFVRVRDALDASADQSLRAQAAETATHLARDGGGGFLEGGGDEPAYGQLLASDGRVLRSTSATPRPLVDDGVRAEVSAGATVFRTAHLPGLRGDWRLLATPVPVDGRPRVLVLARSLESREESLHHLIRQFLIAGPIALVLASLAGYGLAAAALRPVDAMRRRAQAISASTPGRRLPVPSTGDEIERLATTLNDMLARLEAAFAHERRFVADASHELRTPLALLRTELEVALRRPRPRVELEAALRSAAEDAERLSRLAEDLLLIARSDQGGLPVRVETIAIGPVLEDVAARFEERARAHGRRVETTPTDAAADADPERLRQALGNLVDNALLHGAGRVVLSAVERDGAVELHVADEGRGFPPAFIESAFDRFSRADEARPAGGTGLGLSIVALVAAAHGGSAGAANRPEGGADVWLSVPAAAPASRAPEPVAGLPAHS